MRKIVYFALAAMLLSACVRESAVDKYRAEKHVRDSVSLEEQQRSLDFYQSQLEQLMPVADSLVALFKYERNEKYQDHGFYVTTMQDGTRILVRDDGQEMLMYRNGKRLDASGFSPRHAEDSRLVERAEHLQVTIADIRELENRIHRTSLEIQKYQKRLQK